MPGDVARFLGRDRPSVHTRFMRVMPSLEAIAAEPHLGPGSRPDNPQSEHLDDEVKEGTGPKAGGSNHGPQPRSPPRGRVILDSSLVEHVRGVLKA